MIDRFGILPESTKSLFRQTELKLRLEQMGICKLDAGERSGYIEFSAKTSVDPLTLVKLVQGQPSRYKLEGATRLKFELAVPDSDKRIDQIEQLLALLSVMRK